MVQRSDISIAGRYRLVTELGSGAMGTVWRAQDERLNRPVAVKELRPPPDLSDAERAVFYRRTLREARTPAQLKHPSIIDVYDVVVEHGCPWIVMEFVEAPNLDQLIEKEGPIPPAKVADIAVQLLDALSVAHEAGILHRDIKPSNVLLAAKGRVVLTDFGLAISDGAARITASDSFMGSPAYVAPEVARGDQATPQSDLWSLGATLYTAVEGRPPYDRENVMATLSAVLTEEPAPLVRAGVMAPIINGLLQKNPSRRLSHERTADRLDRAIHGPRTARPREPEPRKRLTMALALIAATCATFGIGIGALVVGLINQSPAASNSTAPTVPQANAPRQQPQGASANALVIRAVGGNCQIFVAEPGNIEVLFNGAMDAGDVARFDKPQLNLSIKGKVTDCEIWINGRQQTQGQTTYTITKGQ
jgi:hypothetical protein